MNFKKVLERLNYWHEQDEKMQKATNAYYNVIAPDCLPPIISKSTTEAFIHGVSGGNEDLHSWLNYYIYEAKNMRKATVTEEDGNKYDFTKDDEVIEFLNKNFNNI
jgi:hypothetical protein